MIAAAYLFDWIVGDPEWFPHPVRWIGAAIDRGEHMLRAPDQTPLVELLTGGVLTFAIVTASYVGTAWLIDHAQRRSRWLGIFAESTLAWTCLASRSLHDEASSVMDALDMQDLVLARRRLGRIVGRDTKNLNAAEIHRALIETVAESASDGVIAPLFYMALGRVPLAMAYKAINTLDSMIGHTDEDYFYFGKAAARLDDLANLVPARLTALSIAASAMLVEGTSPGCAIRTWLSDGNKHKSPNAGQPESAMAGALQVRLGGTNSYGEKAAISPTIGDEFPEPSIQSARRAIEIVALASALGLLAALWLRGTRE